MDYAYSKLAAIWNDPVWSKVIAAGVIAVLSLFIVQFRTKIAALIKHNRKKNKLLIYVSSGGTCRDPMAKAITEKLLEKRKLDYKLNIKAAGLGLLSDHQASYASRFVIKEIYHQDLLADHKTELLTPADLKNADLILVMEKSLLLTPQKIFPKEKTFVFKSFFGLEGDIMDPWPDGKDQGTLSRYRKCAEEIKAILEKNIDHLIDVLNQ
jgi:protein-tyrosine-phosphatase